MIYGISGSLPENFYIVLRKGDISENEIESLIYNIENIINDPSTEKYFNDELEAFKKNKFIEIS